MVSRGRIARMSQKDGSLPWIGPSIYGSFHLILRTGQVTARIFANFAGRNQMKKLQNPGLSVPGICVSRGSTTDRFYMWTKATPWVLLLSTEQLISKQLEKLVNDLGFRKRVCILGATAFERIKFMRVRFESALVMIGMIATLLLGNKPSGSASLWASRTTITPWSRLTVGSKSSSFSVYSVTALIIGGFRTFGGSSMTCGRRRLLFSVPTSATASASFLTSAEDGSEPTMHSIG